MLLSTKEQTMRKCSVCGTEKKETEFYTGYAKCKSCRYKVVQAYRLSSAGKEARRRERRRAKKLGQNYEWQKRYDASALGKAAARRYERKRYQGPQGKARQAAKNAVKYAVRVGNLKRRPCEICGARKVHAHHESYAWADRLKVRWLCEEHHNAIHNPPTM
jgi:hypothetical protein